MKMALTATDLKNIGEVVETSIEAAIEASEARMTAKIDESAQQVIDDLTALVRDSQQTIADVMDEKFAEVNGRLDRLERGRQAWS